MKTTALVGAALAASCLTAAETAVPAATLAATNTPPPAVLESREGGLRADAGADLRVRQEIMHNIVGNPGAPGAMMPRAYKKDINHIRFRPRVWGRLDYENFTLYGRLVDEFREHVVENGVKRKRRSYNFPDEVVLDNLFLEGRGLFDGFFDFRIGRQDLFERGHSVFGLDRTLFDGAPYVGSRSAYADMMKFTFHTSDDSKLDAFALYDNGRNIYRYGNRLSRGRPMNAIHPADSPEMDEWGGGLVWHHSLFEKRLPYKLYMIHKHNEDYTAFNGRHVRDKQITTFGALLTPELTENVSFEFEGAHQFGTADSGRKQAGGTMGYMAVDFHRDREAQGLKPYARLSSYYLSGDRNRTGADDNDTAWDPLWGRWPQDSELFQYGTLYGLGYWSNMIYTKLELGLNIGPRHRVAAYSGPIFAAVQDRIGHADGSGDSMFKGVLSVVRYDFPIILAPKKARGIDRFEVFGHIMAEVFNPGDYYDSSRPSYFIRWEFSISF